MARPNKYQNGFPAWKPIGEVKRIIGEGRESYLFKINNDREKLYRLLRNSSSRFISKPEVRDFIFKRDNYKCLNCNNTNNLTIDHKISVYACAQGKIHFYDLNTENNLQTLCFMCNSSKKP